MSDCAPQKCFCRHVLGYLLNVRSHMFWHMVTDAEVRRLPVPEKLLMFADSYLDAAMALCTQVATDRAKCTWSSGSVVLMLSAHATELFLKAALLKRAPEETVWARAHAILGP